MRNPWLKLGLDAWSLGMDASVVIGLRTLKIAAGGVEAQREAVLMVQEKLESAAILQTRALQFRLGDTPHAATQRTLTHYRRKVSSNRRRLSKA